MSSRPWLRRLSGGAAALAALAASFVLPAAAQAPFHVPDLTASASGLDKLGHLAQANGAFNAEQIPLSITLTASDPQAEIFYTTDGTIPNVQSQPRLGTRFDPATPIRVETTTTLNFMAVLTSGAGVSQTATQTAKYTVDTVAPTVALSGVQSLYNSSQPTGIGASAADNTGGAGLASVRFQFRAVGDTAFMPLNTVTGAGPLAAGPLGLEWGTAMLADGSYAVEAIATDLAGNPSTPAVAMFTVDTTAPTATVSGLAGDGMRPNFRGTVTASITATDGGVGLNTLEFNLDNGGWIDALTGAPTMASPAGARAARAVPASNTLGGEVSIPGEGSHTLQLRATDLAGNFSALASETFLIDKTAPTAVLSGVQPLYNSSQPAGIGATADDIGGSGVASVRFEFRAVGDTAFTALNTATAAGPLSLDWGTTMLADGNYAVEAIATDLAGNSLTAPAATFAVDTVAPTITVSLPGGSYSQAQSVTLAASEPGARLFYTLDGSDPDPAAALATQFVPDLSAPIAIPMPAQPGTLTTTLKVLALDPAGNRSPILTEMYSIVLPEPILAPEPVPTSGGSSSPPAPRPTATPVPEPVVARPVVVPAPEPAPAPMPALAPSTALIAASGGSATLALDGGREALVSLDATALADVGAEMSLVVAYDPAPTPPNEAAAGSLGGGNIVPLARPIGLRLSLRDASGQEQAIPAAFADRMFDVRLPVLVHPQQSEVQMAWLMEVKDAQGQFFGYLRMPAEFEPATDSLHYRVALGAGQGRLLLPALVVPAYVKNHDPAVHIWSSPMSDAVDFGVAAPQWTLFRVVGPQVGGRIFVYNPATSDYGWIDAAGVGNVGAPM